MEKNASISMSLLPHLPEDRGGFIHPIVRKSDEVCAALSLVGWERCGLPILLAAFGFSRKMRSASGFSVSCFFQLPVDPMKFVLCRA